MIALIILITLAVVFAFICPTSLPVNITNWPTEKEDETETS